MDNIEDKSEVIPWHLLIVGGLLMNKIVFTSNFRHAAGQCHCGLRNQGRGTWKVLYLRKDEEPMGNKNGCTGLVNKCLLYIQ